MDSVVNLRSVGVHDGGFHADEVTACALLILFNLVDKDKVVRTRDTALLARCEYVCDVGGIYDIEKKLFDHHQAEYKGSFSSAGMILDYLKRKGLLSDKEYDFFNQSLIYGVDEHDNGRAPQLFGVTTFSQVIANFTTVTYEPTEEESQQAFQSALSFVLGHLTRMYERYNFNKQCRTLVEEAMKKHQDCLIFDKAIPWQDSFFELGGENHPASFVVMPSGEHWKLRGIPPDLQKKMQVRVPLPQSWAGLSDEALQKASGLNGAIFCHKGRFISVWKSKDDALEALKTILKQERIR